MILGRLALAALAAWVVYFILGGVMFAAIPTMRNEFAKYPAVYRSQDAMKKVMPFGMVTMFVAMFVLAHLFAMAHLHGSDFERGAVFGGLIGVFFDCVFVAHNHVNLNIGTKLSLQQAVAYFIQWVVAGIVISLVYGHPGT
jgi:predicted lysophospholipase L1 biosynthesis ABC-type transport system permease subunit